MKHPMTTMLHGRVEMPMHGLGTYKATEGEDVINSVTWALQAGYRMFDTAAIYRNEGGVGEAIRRSDLVRTEVFVTTKLWNSDQGYDRALDALDGSLQILGFDYIDLYLVHWPKPEHMAETWRAMEQALADGLTRAIGVCNFEPHHLDQLMATANTPPSLNQVELHPNLQQHEVRAATLELGGVPQAWSPLKQGRVLDDPVVVAIADRHNRTPAQVVLRWQLQEGVATIPKSITKRRIIENGDVFGFALDDADMEHIRGLDTGDRIGPHPDRIDF